MVVGEVMSALITCASDWDGDHLLLLKGVYCIDVRDNYIDVFFTDGNTENIRINKDGRIIPMEE